MKRMRTTMIALAVSGSLVAGVTPAAMAVDNGSDKPADNKSSSTSAIVSNGDDKPADSKNSSKAEEPKPEEPKQEEPKPEEPKQEDPTKISIADEVVGRIQTDFNAYTLKGTNAPSFFRHHCGEWLTDQSRIGSDVALTKADLAKSKDIQGQIRADVLKRIEANEDPMAGAQNVEDPSPIGASVECKIAEDPSTTPGLSDKFDPRLLGIILPATLIIGGVIWYLSQDGKTYVQDPARANAQPTAEEQKASEQMLKDNAEEVKRQAGAAGDAKSQAQDAKDAAAHGQRGMLAQTGNNDVARGLFALVLLSVVGAAAFLARRRFSA